MQKLVMLQVGTGVALLLRGRTEFVIGETVRLYLSVLNSHRFPESAQERPDYLLMPIDEDVERALRSPANLGDECTVVNAHRSGA